MALECMPAVGQGISDCAWRIYPMTEMKLETLIEDKSVIANIAPEKYATEIFEDFYKSYG